MHHHQGCIGSRQGIPSVRHCKVFRCHSADIGTYTRARGRRTIVLVQPTESTIWTPFGWVIIRKLEHKPTVFVITVFTSAKLGTQTRLLGARRFQTLGTAWQQSAIFGTRTGLVSFHFLKVRLRPDWTPTMADSICFLVVIVASEAQFLRRF